MLLAALTGAMHVVRLPGLTSSASFDWRLLLAEVRFRSPPALFSPCGGLRAASSEVVRSSDSAGEPVGSGHVGHDPFGVDIGDPAGRCDVERSSCSPAEHLDCVSGRAERCLGDANNGDADGGRSVCSQSWLPLGVEGGVTIDDQELKARGRGKDRADAWEFPLVERTWFVRGDVG